MTGGKRRLGKAGWIHKQRRKKTEGRLAESLAGGDVLCKVGLGVVTRGQNEEG